MNPNNIHLLQGGLPAPPQGGQPPPIRPVNTITPTMPYQESGATSVISAITNFVNNFRQSKEQVKQQAAQEADRDLKLLSLGIPIKQDKLAKNLQKAGIELDYGTPPPQVPNPQQPPQQVQVPTNSPVPGQQSMPSQIPQGMMQGQAPQQQQSMWSRFKGAMGQQQPIAPNSPAMQMIAQQAQQGQQMQQLQQKKMQMEFLTAENGMNAAIIMKGVLQGDAKAQEMARMSGLLPMLPIDQILVAGRKMGMTDGQTTAKYLSAQFGDREVSKMIYDQAGKMADRFGGDIAKAAQYMTDLMNGDVPKDTPGRTFQENLDIAKIANTVRQEYPMLPPAQAQIMAMAQVSGDKELLQKFSTLLAKMPSKSSLDMLNAQMSIKGKENDIRHSQVMERISAANAQTAQAGLALRAESNRLTALSIISNQAGDAFNRAYRMMADKDATPEQKKEATQMAADAINSMPPIPFQIQGKDGKITTKMFDPAEVKLAEIKHWFSDNEYYLASVGETFGEGDKPKVESPKMDALSKFLSGIDWSSNIIIPTMVPGQ